MGGAAMSPQQILDSCAEGRNPSLIARMASGFVVLANNQYLPGYCILLRHPLVAQLNDLQGEGRTQFLADMASLGDAVRKATRCNRVNYGVYGNLDPYLHAHVWPRYADEPEAQRTMPPFLIPVEIREAPETAFDPATHKELMLAVRAALG